MKYMILFHSKESCILKADTSLVTFSSSEEITGYVMSYGSCQMCKMRIAKRRMYFDSKKVP